MNGERIRSSLIPGIHGLRGSEKPSYIGLGHGGFYSQSSNCIHVIHVCFLHKTTSMLLNPKHALENNCSRTVFCVSYIVRNSWNSNKCIILTDIGKYHYIHISVNIQA